MSRLCTIVLSLLAILSGTLAHAGEIVRGSIVSASLKRDFPFIVYVPDGSSASQQQRYSVLYLLHGAGGDENDWIANARVKDTADALIKSGKIPPTLIVMPSCPTCWWVDGRQDKAETAFWSELVPAIDERYRTIARREGRLIAGVSAGGFGAIRYGLKYADRVAAVAALSPAVYAQTPPADSAARRQPPFTRTDGRFDAEAWTAKNYPALLDAYGAQPKRVPVYLVAGDGDKLGIAFEAALLHKRLTELQSNHAELRVVDGEHSWKLWASALPDAMTFLYRQTPSLIVQTPNRITTVDVR